MHDVAVLGGGIAGLTAAWQLKQLGLDVALLESAPQAGGNIRTFEHEGFRLETGPYSFLGTYEYMWRLVDELGIIDRVEPSSAAADNRYIYRDGRLLPLPLSPGAFIATRLLSLGGKLRLMAEPFVRGGAKPDDTAWEFFVRRFGLEAATYIMGPFVSGIYAGDARLLGARAAFPKFHGFEAESGSMIRGAFKYMLAKRRNRGGMKKHRMKGSLFSFYGGLGAITSELAARLNGRITTGVRVESVAYQEGAYTISSPGGQWRTRAVVSAVPPPVAAAILGGMVPGMAASLQAIPMSPVTLAHWSQPDEQHVAPAGFGFLMPRLYPLRVLGTVFASQLFSSRAPAGQALFSSFYGGMTDPDVMRLSDNDMRALLLREHEEVFKTALRPPQMLKILRYPGAIPQLLPDHPERMAAIREQLGLFPGLFLAGNYLTGVGVEHAVASGYLAAHEVASFLGLSRQVTAEAA